MVMILILVALISLFSISLWVVEAGNFRFGFIRDFLCPMLAVLSGVGLIAYIFLVFFYHAAGVKAQIINREFNTAYTQSQVFYASDVIDEVRELKRSRMEINGNLLKNDH